jgi:carboxypeptidase C (cathepsin A)
MDDVANEFIVFMLELYELHPEFKSVPFYIAGESYAGKFIPLFSHKIIEYNALNEAFKIPLNGVLVGNPFAAPAI